MNGVEPKQKTGKLDGAVLKTAIILTIGVLAPLFDSTMVNVAIHAIAREMRASTAVIQWITTGYVLAIGLTVPISGWASKRYGCKRSYVFALGVFLLGSICSMLSWNIVSLIAARVIQGVGAGILMPVMQTELVQVSGGKNLGKIMAIVSIPALLGPILGPVLGGIIVNYLNWRAIFWVNIPICAIAFALVIWGLPADRPTPGTAPLDVVGLLLLSPAFALLVYGISQIARKGTFLAPGVLVPLVAGVILMAGYSIYALVSKREPVLDIRLFKYRNFCASNILLVFSGIITNGALLMLPLYYQEARGASPLSAGLWLLPQGIGMLLTRSWVAKISERVGPKPIVLASLAGVAIGTIPFAFANGSTGFITLAIALLVRGAGLGGLFITIMMSAYVGIRAEQVSHASTATRIFQTIGGAFGSAILATVFQSHMAGHGASDIPALSRAFDASFWWSIGFTAAAVIPTIFLSSREQAKTAQKGQPEGFTGD